LRFEVSVGKSYRDPISTNRQGMVRPAELYIGGQWCELSPGGKAEDPIRTISKAKRAGDVAQVEAPSSNPE
jgi:hypothetical protein